MNPTFRSMREFYGTRGGERSGEVDFGVWWRLGEPPREQPWRVSWVRDTGDVYAVAARTGSVELLGTIPSEDELERRFAGWADVCGEPRSLQWARSAAS
jgi:hypothetical protein